MNLINRTVVCACLVLNQVRSCTFRWTFNLVRGDCSDLRTETDAKHKKASGCSCPKKVQDPPGASRVSEPSSKPLDWSLTFL